MTYVLPPTPEAVARQVDHYEWVKKHFPGLYVAEVEVAEQRGEVPA